MSVQKQGQIIPFRPQQEMSIQTLGQIFADSGFFGDSRQAAQCITKILAGRELGIAPIAAMTGIYLVKGRITLGANLIAGLIKRSPRYDYRIKELSGERCVIVFSEDGRPAGESSFTIQEAAAAGLKEGDNWRKYPRNMLFSRALSNGAKWYCPDLFAGPVYTPDELGVLVDGETGTPLADPITGEVIEGSVIPSSFSPQPVKPPAERAPEKGPSIQDRVFAGWVKTGEAGIWTGFADADEFWEWMNGATNADIKARANLWATAIKRAEATGWAESWKLMAQAGMTEGLDRFDALPADTPEDVMRQNAVALAESARAILHDDGSAPEPEGAPAEHFEV